MKKLKLVILFLALCFFALPAFAQTNGADVSPAQERIISYDSKIQVNSDASLTVAERIKVHAAGDQIKHGIYRDFPTRYKDNQGNNYNVGFKVLSVTKDGVDENFWTESQGNGVRIYIGQKDVLLEPGDYTYEIVYQTTRQLGFFKDHDELYWNVTGNGWIFPIEKATAQVIVPGVTPEQMKLDGFTGPQGATDKNFNIDTSSGHPVFVTTQALDSYEGLTIVVGWPKGIVAEPTTSQKLTYFFSDNSGPLVGLVGLIIVLLYFLASWAKVGRDPQKGTIIAQYEPPLGISPAGVGYIQKMGYEQKHFTAAVIDMAIKGYLKIVKPESVYHLEKTGKDDLLLSPEEKEIAQLFKSSDKIELENSHHSTISSALQNFQKSLGLQFLKKYFIKNGAYFIFGLGITLIIGIILIVFTVNYNPDALASIVWLIFTSTFVAIIGKSYITFRADLSLSGILSLIRKVIMLLFLGIFIIVTIFGIAASFSTGNALVALPLILLIFINVTFYYLLKAPTVLGRKTMDEIEGFKLFLTVTEKDRMNFHNPPEKTPELFEKYLPYALALGVDNKWAEQFNEVFARLKAEGSEYIPLWYVGVFNFHSLGDFSSSLSHSLNSAISSASVAPGSSSGFGGGGFSGGGGGGGGGGGW